MDDASTSAALRGLPAVGTLLGTREISVLIEQHGRALVVEAARQVLQDARARILDGAAVSVGPEDVARAATQLARPNLRRVINATGVLLHTNLGRAPLARAAERAVREVARGYSTLELELETGERGSRQAHVSALLAALLDAEAAIAVNNCAGAVLLMLAALCRGKEVIVSRGELVEIGGGFRVPDVMRESGAVLVEVGTTNKVYARDYEAAITERTGAILWVHRSNFALVGFTHAPEPEELALVASKAGIPFLADVGSGLIAGDGDLGPSAALLAEEPRPDVLLRAGADVVALSGDKLLGGPQAGILAGRGALIEKMRQHPLARALRADKLSLAALEATVRLYRDGKAREIPLVRALSEPEAAIADRATTLRDLLSGVCPELAVEVRKEEALVGGGSLPLVRLPTVVLLAGAPAGHARRLAATLRAQDPPVITRVVDDRVAIDLRTVSGEELSELAALLARAESSAGKNGIESKRGKE